MTKHALDGRVAAEPDPQKLWLAARRLAQGDAVAVAANAARMHPGTLAQMQATDLDFRELIGGARRILKMEDGAWRARLGGQLRFASEQVLEEARVSFVNLLTRSLGAVDTGPQARPPGPLAPDEEARVYLEALSKLKPEAVLEFILARQQRFAMPPEERAAILARWRAKCAGAMPPEVEMGSSHGPSTAGWADAPDGTGSAFGTDTAFKTGLHEEPLEPFGVPIPEPVPAATEPGPVGVLRGDGWEMVRQPPANDDGERPRSVFGTFPGNGTGPAFGTRPAGRTEAAVGTDPTVGALPPSPGDG